MLNFPGTHLKVSTLKLKKKKYKTFTAGVVLIMSVELGCKLGQIVYLNSDIAVLLKKVLPLNLILAPLPYPCICKIHLLLFFQYASISH